MRKTAVAIAPLWPFFSFVYKHPQPCSTLGLKGKREKKATQRPTLQDLWHWLREPVGSFGLPRIATAREGADRCHTDTIQVRQLSLAIRGGEMACGTVCQLGSKLLHLTAFSESVERDQNNNKKKKKLTFGGG